MSKETREHLSCLVDGEISRETSQFLVRRLGSDAELRATWARYHLVRDCIRHQNGDMAGSDLPERISRALQNEAPGRAPRRLPGRWLRPITGVAVAASVALMAIIAVGPGKTPTTGGAAGDLASERGVESFTSPQIHGPVPYSSQASLNGHSNRQGRQMSSYLVRHYQASEATGGRHFVTYLPIVISQARVVDPEAGTDRVEVDGEDETVQR